MLRIDLRPTLRRRLRLSAQRRPLLLWRPNADVAQLVEHHLAKVRVAGSNPVVRSRLKPWSEAVSSVVDQVTFRRALNRDVKRLRDSRYRFCGGCRGLMSRNLLAARAVLKPVRDGVWRIDVELPRVPGERTAAGVSDDPRYQEDAETERSTDLAGRVDELAATTSRSQRTSTGAKTRRARQSGAITRLGVGSLARRRRRAGRPGDRTAPAAHPDVRGTREQAEVALARLKLASRPAACRPLPARRRCVWRASSTCARRAPSCRPSGPTERRATASARPCCRAERCSATVPLSKVDWKIVEQVFAKWDGAIEPSTKARYASTLSKVLEHAKRTGWIAIEPGADARRPKVPTHRPRVPATVRCGRRSASRRPRTSRSTPT